MSEPTASNVLSDALTRWSNAGDFGPAFDDNTWDAAMADACEALGIDPDAPLSLLFSHARAEGFRAGLERAAEIAEGQMGRDADYDDACEDIADRISAEGDR